MLTHNNITNTVYKKLVDACNDLHKQLNDITVTRYKYLGNGRFDPPNVPQQGGIYVMFEKGEKYNDHERVVRVGKADGSLLKRLNQHFKNNNKDSSILRKHIGRSLLHKCGEQNNATYKSAVQDWNTKGVGNPELEEKVTKYLIDNISFCVIPLSDKDQIRKLEQELIEVLSSHNRLYHEITGNYVQTDEWLGNYCKENPKVMESGMWNDEHMGKSVVESTLNRVKKHLDSEKGFFIISTHLPNMDEETEVKRANALVEELKQRGLGYIPLRGKYTREDTGEIEYEHSFFIPNTRMGDFKGIAKELCKSYGQESVVFAEKGKAYFLDSNGSMSLLGETVGEVEELNQFWSKLKKGKDNKKFWAFESLYPMSNFALNAAHNWGELF